VQSDASGLQNVDTLSFSCSGGTGVVSINSVPEHVTPNLCFCIRGVKRRHIICHARWDRYGFHKMHTTTRYAEIVFLHQVGSAGHMVLSGVSRT
jgi:hypothetical protein